MTFQHFKARLAEYKKLPSADCLDDPETLKQHPDYRYALSTRTRGRGYVDRIMRICANPIDELSILDVGCAYGGITIEAALAGARASGVEVVRSYADLARHNARDEVDVEIFEGDMTVRPTVAQMGDGTRFNTFIINHVLEHIYDTVSLLENIDRIASKDAIIFFDVPNGHSIISFMAEGHTNIFGVSLADPDCWNIFGQDRARIYYRKLRYFQALFESFGFKISIAKDRSLKPRAEMEAILQKSMLEAREKAKASKISKTTLDEVLLRFCSEIEYDLIHASESELDLKYFHYFWRGIAYRAIDRIRPEYREAIPLAAWGD